MLYTTYSAQCNDSDEYSEYQSKTKCHSDSLKQNCTIKTFVNIRDNERIDHQSITIDQTNSRNLTCQLMLQPTRIWNRHTVR